MAVTLDNRITIGNVLTLLTLGAAMAGGYAATRADLATVSEKVSVLEAHEHQREDDHDILIRIETELKEIRQAVARPGDLKGG